MKRLFFFIQLLAIASTSFAQEQLRVGDILDLEERIMIKKMTDELTKPNPNAPPPAPIVISPKAPKIVYPTETLAVYGTSATYYEGQLSLGGTTYTVRNGTPVAEYVVSSVSPAGIQLTKLVPAKKRGKKGGQAELKKVTLFAPLVGR